MKNKKIVLFAAIATLSLFVGSVVVVANTHASVKPTGQNPNRIYDVNRDGRINFQDAGLCYVYYKENVQQHHYGNLLYDVNCDHSVDMDDVMLIWQNRD